MQPLGPDSDAAMADLWNMLTKGEPVAPTSLEHRGRVVEVPEAAEKTKTARFTFGDLCSKPLGAADYIVVAKVRAALMFARLRCIQPLGTFAYLAC